MQFPPFPPHVTCATDNVLTPLPVKLVFGRGVGCFLADSATGHVRAARHGITHNSICEKVRQAGAHYRLIPEHAGPALQANDRLFGALKGRPYRNLREHRGVGGPPRKRLAMADRQVTPRAGNLRGLPAIAPPPWMDGLAMVLMEALCMAHTHRGDLSWHTLSSMLLCKRGRTFLCAWSPLHGRRL